MDCFCCMVCVCFYFFPLVKAEWRQTVKALRRRVDPDRVTSLPKGYFAVNEQSFPMPVNVVSFDLAIFRILSDLCILIQWTYSVQPCPGRLLSAWKRRSNIQYTEKRIEWIVSLFPTQESYYMMNIQWQIRIYLINFIIIGILIIKQSKVWKLII